MIREEGFYIVKKKGVVGYSEHFLWIYNKRGKKFFLLDDSYPTLFTEDSSYTLEGYTFVKKLSANRKDLNFSKTKITITTEYGNNTFEFQHRSLIQFYRLIVILLPGIGKNLMFGDFLKRIINDLKQGNIKKESL